MLDGRPCVVKTAGELDSQIRDILALEAVERGSEISGTLYVDYSDEAGKGASLIDALECWGVDIVWRRTQP